MLQVTSLVQRIPSSIVNCSSFGSKVSLEDHHSLAVVIFYLLYIFPHPVLAPFIVGIHAFFVISCNNKIQRTNPLCKLSEVIKTIPSLQKVTKCRKTKVFFYIYLQKWIHIVHRIIQKISNCLLFLFAFLVREYDEENASEIKLVCILQKKS